jgi:hypothetical protein
MWLGAAAGATAELRFVHHFGDRNLEGRNLGQTDLADLDRDGDLDFISGKQRGRRGGSSGKTSTARESSSSE